MTTNTTPAVPNSAQSAGWASWVALATLRASGGVGTPASHEDVGTALASLVGANSVGANTVPAGAFYARKAGWMTSPKRGQHAVTGEGVAALAGMGFPVGDAPVPVVEPVAAPVPVEPVVEEVAKAAEIIAFPTPTPAPEPVLAPVSIPDPYAGADDYIVGLAAAATPCFGSYSARAKTTCGACPLAARCSGSALTRMAEVAALIEREEAEKVRLAAEAEARAAREAEEARIRAEREAEEARVRDEAWARAAAATPPVTNPTHTGAGATGSLHDVLAAMASMAPAPVPMPNGGTVMVVAFDAVCAGCRRTIPRDSSAVHIGGKGLFHASCDNA